MNSKESFDRYQHSNGEIVLSFCKKRMFPQYKFLQPSYVMFSLETPRSLCRKINKLIERPSSITSEIDEEFYWVNFTVPMINQKYCEIRSNFNTEVKKKYIGEQQQFVNLFLMFGKLRPKQIKTETNTKIDMLIQNVLKRMQERWEMT
jgi:hypothetical protein